MTLEQISDASQVVAAVAVVLSLVALWWATNPISLSAEYRAFIDGLIREAQANSGGSS